MGTMYVYFAQAGEGGPVKIGIAKDVKQRITNLQTGNPKRIKLLCSPMVDESQANLTESYLHRIFHGFRLEGEWFKPSPWMLSFIEDIGRRGIMDNRPRGKNHYNWQGGRRIDACGYILIHKPEHPRSNVKGYILEHILIAEKALGKPLPAGVQIHHANEERADNRSSNLVICENQKYHGLLHRRLLAYKATGNPRMRWCGYCKKWDMNIEQSDGRFYHKSCRRLSDQKRYKERKNANTMSR